MSTSLKISLLTTCEAVSPHAVDHQYDCCGSEDDIEPHA